MSAGLRAVAGGREETELALARDVAQAQADDPLTPVAVLIGGTLMRPYLQRRLATLNGGIANVHFITASELALALGERALVDQGRRPLPPLADRVLLRQIGGEHDGYFEPVRDTPGFGDALHRLTRELRGAAYDQASFTAAADSACDAPGKAEALGEIFGDFLERRSQMYGPDDCLLAAEATSAPWTWLGIFGLWDPSAALGDVLSELAATIPVSAYVPATRTSVDRGAAGISDWAARSGATTESLPPIEPRDATTLTHVQATAFADEEVPAAGFDTSLKLLSGPDPTREIREVARACMGWAREGIAFHEMAVIYRHQDSYRPVIEAVFAEADIPLYLHEGAPLIERPLGRRVAALLDLIGTNMERRSVMDLLTDAALPNSTRNEYAGFSATRWDRISREAGVLEGIDQWRRRLADYASAERERGGTYAEANAERADGLLAFVEDLHANLRRHAPRGPWSEHLKSLERLLKRYVYKPDDVTEALRGLGRLDSVTGEVSFDRFREIARGAIETLRSDEVLGTRTGAFGRRGVNVLDANSARHLAFRAVAIVGVAERSFPPPPSQDPLLLDDERERFSDAGPRPIPLRTRGPNPEPLQFALAVNAAKERLLVSYPRKSAGERRPQLPSSFFRAVAEAAMGKSVPVEKVDELPTDLYERVSGSRIGSGVLDRSLSAVEHDRTLIESSPALGRAALVAAEPRVSRAFAARAARFSRKLTPYDGVLSDDALGPLATVRPADKSFSPSGLETYADCPQRFLLGSVLGIRNIHEPEATVSISAADRGTLIHRVLERFLGTPPDPGPLLHGPGEEQRLLTILEEECQLAEGRGETGYPLTWRYDRAELTEDLQLWLDHERQDPSFAAMPEGAFEVVFGRSWAGPSEGELSQDEPLEITAGGVSLRVSGRIDRLNWNEDRTEFRVIDYKTGRLWNDDAGTFRGGQALQLPLYLLAAEVLTGIPADQGKAEYHYATRRGKFTRVPFEGRDLDERRDDFNEVLGSIITGTREGLFPMVPGTRKCGYCPFDRVCPTGRAAQMERKEEDPRAVALLAREEIA
jgi:RecB family exonuclease